MVRNVLRKRVLHPNANTPEKIELLFTHPIMMRGAIEVSNRQERYQQKEYLDPLQGRHAPQGGVISPILSNLFMHYTFDLWMKLYVEHKGQAAGFYVRAT